MTGLKSLWEFIRRVVRRFIADACSGRAAGLAFSTLFALVPLSAFVIAVLNAFGAFDPLIQEAQQALIEQLVPAVHEEVFASIRQFASNTRALGFLGLFIFLGTAILLLRNINISLNAIWGFRVKRKLWSKIASYTSVIVLGTTLVSAGFVLGPAVQSLLNAVLPGGSQATVFRDVILPPILFFLAIFSLNILVPAGRIAPASAAVGAAVTVFIWEFGKRLFVFWSTSVVRFNLMYGSLAVLPIFLIWLYLSWFFILVGVEVSYLFQHRGETFGAEDDEKIHGPVSVVVDHCVNTALSVCRRHRDGERAELPEELDFVLGVAAADRVRVSLGGSGLFLNTDHGLLPARAANSITADDLVHCLAGPSGRALLDVWKTNPLIALTDCSPELPDDGGTASVDDIDSSEPPPKVDNAG